MRSGRPNLVRAGRQQPHGMLGIGVDSGSPLFVQTIFSHQGLWPKGLTLMEWGCHQIPVRGITPVSFVMTGGNAPILLDPGKICDQMGPLAGFLVLGPGLNHQKRTNGGQEDSRTEDGGAAVVAGCKTPPALQSGKERLDCVTLAIQPPAVMDWFPAAATGQNARRDALPGTASYGLCPCPTLDPPSPWPQAAGLCAPHQHR